MRIGWLLPLSLVAATLALSVHADEGADRRAALRQAQEPLRDRRWAEAVPALRAVRTKWPASEEAIEAWVLEARALLQAGQAREALDATSAFLAAHGQDLWGGRVRHTAAEAYAALTEPAKASEALQRLADEVTAPEARASIGLLHLKLADEDFDGVDAKDDLGRTVKRRDMARALASYRRALEVGLPPSEALRARERVARVLEETGDFAGARAAWAALAKEAETEKRPGSAEQAERWLVGEGRAALRSGKPDEARVLLRKALETFPKGALALETLLLLGQERLTPRNGQVDDLAFEEGVTWLRRAILEHRDQPAAVEAQVLLAEAYAARGQSEKAAQEWSALVDRRPQDLNAPLWRDRAATALAQAGRFDEAIAEWNRFLASYANHPLWPQVREKIAAAGLAKAQMLLERGDTAGAVAAWKRFAEERPEDPRAPGGLGQAAQALRTAKDPEGALTLWRAVAGRYAATPHAAQARLQIAFILEEDLKRLEEAVAAYDEVVAKHAGTPQAQQAQERLQRLKSKHLEVRMERVQGSDEAPVLHVVTRNVEGLRVRVYRLGIEEYFTRKGTLEGVEALQLEVVKPDLTSEWKFEGYKPFTLLEADRPLPVKGPGAFVVVAGDDDLTSTVLFVVSDVELVVKKAGGRDLFVWAFDRASHAPVVGARILVADGAKVTEVGKTGADGTWHGEHGGSRDRVLVLAERGAAGSELGSVPSVASGFTTRAWIATDRPVYRPGQEVSWRAVFLKASDGAYSVPVRPTGQLSLLDARGQVLLEREVKGGDFGTFTGTLPLDSEAPLGTWRLRLSVHGEGTWDGTFEVQEYRKPEFTVDVVAKQPAWLTGQKVEATIALNYAFGGPVPGARVEWSVRRQPRLFEAPKPDDVSWYLKAPEDARDREQRGQGSGAIVARGEGRTAADGTLKIEFDTGAADEDAEFVVTAAAEDVTRRWVTGSARVAATRRDHLASIRVERAVVKPKEPVTVEVRTMDAGLAPVSRSGSVVLLRVRRTLQQVPPHVPPGPPVPPGPRPMEDRKGGARPLTEEEVEVASYPVTTDARGRAELRVQAPEPGRWRVKWKAVDARGNLVSAQADLEALGEAQDLTKEARLVASRLLHVEGEEAELLLSAPVGQATALVTYEGEKVLEHLFVRITGASTLLRLPVKGAHAPNVTIAVAVPGKERLLTAQAEIVVLRRLTVDVRFAKESAGPGEEVEAVVTARDAAGKPVVAELGFSLIDAALYEIASDSTPAILPYFYGQRRGHAVVTSSSLGWRTYGTTRATSADLLAEAAARGGGAEEEMARSALRLARESMRRGDMDVAVAQALQAQQADPGSWDARALLAELKAKPEAQDALRRLEPALDAMDTAGAMADAAPAPSPPAAAPRPGKSAPMDKKSKDETDNDMPAEESKQSLGTGGGAGGSFKGRGGSVADRKAGGKVARETVASHGAELERASEMIASLQRGISPAELAKSLAAFGADPDTQAAALTLRADLRDSAAWMPSVVTGEDGKATVKVKLPDNLTTWRAVVHGVSKGALVGEGRGSLVSRKDLLVRVDAPRFLVQSDQATLPTAVHNGTDRGLDVTVTMKAEGLDLAGENQRVKVDGGASAVVDRPVTSPAFGAARLEVAAVFDGGGDKTEARLPVLARGVRFVDGRSGLVSTEQGDTQETFVEVPADVVPGSTRLSLALQPGIDQAILEALVSLDLYPYGCVEQTVHRFLPAIEARAALKAIGSPAVDKLARLDEAVARGAARLVSIQNPDGTFGWWRGGKGNLAMSAYALLGLAGAQDAGVRDLNAPIARAVQGLTKILAQGDEDGRALAHWALARAKGLNADAYASTFRRRNDDLSIPGLAYLTIAAKLANRSFDVEECARLLLERKVEDGATTYWKAKPQDCFHGSDREATALAVRALIAANLAAPHAERGLAWLLAHRPQGGAGTTKEAAAFVGAAAAFVQSGRVQGFGGTVEVLLDGTVVHTLKTGGGAPDGAALRLVLTGGASLAPGRHKVAFRLAGEGRLAWALRLDGVRATDELPAEEHGVLVERRFLVPEKALLDGEQAPTKPGYDILRPAARPKVELRDLERAGSGEPVLVRLTLTAPRDLEYVLVEDPLPAGFEVVAESARGPFDWQERRDTKQVFFCSKVGKGVVTLEYVLQATHLGRFTALGTTAAAMYAPEIYGRAAGRVLSVVPREDAHRPDAEVPPTPDEVYARAKDLLAKKQDDEARRLLTALKADQPLRDEVIEEIETLLLGLAIRRTDAQGRGDAREVVRAREELLRRNPRRVPFDLESARTIAAAYREVGEHEAASTLLRDLVARGYAFEVDWSQTLAARGREVEGLDALERRSRRFPVSNATAAAGFRAAQRWREVRRPEGRGARPAGKPMDEETLDALWSLTAHYAHHLVADPAGYALVEALRRTKDLGAAGAAAEAFLRRFPASAFADDARYFLAETRFKAFEEAPGPETAKAVREAATPLTVGGRFPNTDGSFSSVSEFRDRAYHLLARVAHVLGDLSEAERLYEQASSVEDAREALAWLRAKSLGLDDTVVRLGEGSALLPVRYRNLEKVTLRAYPVDVQVLFAVRKTLEGLNTIDLSGIAAQREWEVPLPPVPGRTAGEAQVDAGVPASAFGAWLIIAKAGDLEAGTLVVKTTLAAALQRVGEKVRVNVRDAAGQPVRGAYVAVSDGQRIRARGLTDARGVFEAPGVGATAFAVISKGDQVALAR